MRLARNQLGVSSFNQLQVKAERAYLGAGQEGRAESEGAGLRGSGQVVTAVTGVCATSVCQPVQSLPRTIIIIITL